MLVYAVSMLSSSAVLWYRAITKTPLPYDYITFGFHVAIMISRILYIIYVAVV